MLLPVGAATLVSRLAFWIAPDKTIDGSMRILIPALVTFIPGSLLTTATLDLGAFTGALVATPVAAWVATRPSGPPSLATFLPAFWLLVPGAVGLIGMAEFVGSNREAGLDHFVNALITFVSIGIGVLVGNALVSRWSSL